MKNFSLLHSRVGSLAQRLMVLSCVLILGATQVWGAKIAYTFSSKSWAASPANWTGSKDGNQFNSSGTPKGVQVLTDQSGVTVTSPTSYTNISKVEVVYSSSKNGTGSINIKIGNNTALGAQSISKSQTETKLTFTPTTPQTGSVVMTCTVTKNSMGVNSVTIYYETAVTLKKNSGTADGAVKFNHDADSYVTGSLTQVSRTGYDCTGYWTATSGGTKILTNTGAIANKNITISSVPYTDSDSKWIYADAALTLHAQWTAKTISLTLNKNNSDASGSSNGSASVKYDATALESGAVHATRTGYELEGYYAEQACTHKVLTSEGALVNYTGYVVSGKWARATATTLYAKWTPVASCTATPTVGAVSLNGPFFVTHLKIFHHIIMSMFASLILKYRTTSTVSILFLYVFCKNSIENCCSFNSWRMFRIREAI